MVVTKSASGISPTGGAHKAIPLSEEEIAALGVEKREVVVSYGVGDSVKITDAQEAVWLLFLLLGGLGLLVGAYGLLRSGGVVPLFLFRHLR